MEIKGKYMMERAENMDAMMKAMGMTEDMMEDMMGSPGMMMEIMMDGDSMTMKRSDGMNMEFTMGKQFDMRMGNMMMKVMPKMDDDMMSMMMTMPDGKMTERRYKFDTSGMVMEMMAQNMMMKMFYKRM